MEVRNAKELLRSLRTKQPFNYLATTGLKRLMQATGVESKLVMRVLPRVGNVRVVLPDGETYEVFSPGADINTSQTFWRGWDALEPETYPVWYFLSKHARTILDIGAYVGQMSLVSAASNPNALVYAFEPMPAVFKQLEAHLEMNDFPNLHCYQLALSDVEGDAEFYYVAGQIGTSSSLDPEFMNHVQSSQELTSSIVKVTTADSWIRSNSITNVDLVKIDTETTEPQVLRGMIDTLTQYEPDLIVECLEGAGTEGKGTQASIDDILLPLGYQAMALHSRTDRQRDINNRLNEITGWQGDRTHNVLYSKRERDLASLVQQADRYSGA